MPGVTTAYQNGVHGSRPAANAGCILYACSTHSLIYRSDGSAWSTWMTIGSTTTTVASDAIWDAAGDLAQGTGADTAAKLSAGTAGHFLMAGGAATALSWKARELDYVEFTGAVTVNQDTEASATTVVTANAVSFDGSTVGMIEFYAPVITPNATLAADNINIWLFDGSSSIGLLAQFTAATATTYRTPIHVARRLTPSNASHTYSIRATVTAAARTGTVQAGAGGSGAYMPGFIRITRAV